MVAAAALIESDTLAQDLIAQARALIPTLKQRAAQATAERRVPAQTIKDMQAAGLFRVLQPKRFGGYELDPQLFFDIQMTLAEGCMSSAWVYGVVAVHAFQLALFDERAQREVWGNDPTTLMSSSYQPVGKVERVDGGYTISGRWGFSSGCDHCGWVLLGAIIPPSEAGGAPDMRTFLVPRSDYKIVHDWTTFGLQGTGSHGIVVENAFVPEYRTHRAIDGFRGNNPGLNVNTAPLYRLPWAQVFVRTVSSSTIGALQAALDAFKGIAAARISTNTGRATKMDPAALNCVARTQSAIYEMKTVIKRNFDEMMALVRAGQEIPLADRVRYRFESAQVARRCAELADAMMPLLGGRAIYMDSPIVPIWLDILAARAHVANDPTIIGAPLGMMYLGETINETFI